MGNHEFCTRCQESDFHHGMTCEDAYPESLKKADQERAERAVEKERGRVLIEDLDKELRLRGIEPVNQGDTLVVYGFELARAEKRNAKHPL